MPGEREPVYLTVKVHGVVLPNWLATAVGTALVLSAVALVIVLQLYRADVLRLNAEIRVLQLHAESIENTLVKNGQAAVRDFPVWTPGSAPYARQNKEQ